MAVALLNKVKRELALWSIGAFSDWLRDGFQQDAVGKPREEAPGREERLEALGHILCVHLSDAAGDLTNWERLICEVEEGAGENGEGMLWVGYESEEKNNEGLGVHRLLLDRAEVEQLHRATAEFLKRPVEDEEP